MSRFTSVLTATLLAASVAACDRDLPSAPEISAGGGSYKSSTVCQSGCTSNYNGMGPGGDTVWIAFGTNAIVAPLSGVSNMIIRGVTTTDPKDGIIVTWVDSSHIGISATTQPCSGVQLGDTTCTRKVSYSAGPAGEKTGNPTTETIVVILFVPPVIQIPIDTVSIQAGNTAIVDPLSGVPNVVLRSVTPTDPKTGVNASEVDSTDMSIATNGSSCSGTLLLRPTCGTVRVTYAAGPANSRVANDTGTIVVILLRPPTPPTPPTIQNVAIPVGLTSPFMPMLIPASHFASDAYGKPLTLTAATALTTVPGLGISVVNGELAVTRLVLLGSGQSITVEVTVSDGTTSATGFITLKLQ